MTPTTYLSLSIRLSMFESRETGDWDIFLGPPERARAETGGADQWVLKRRELSGFARVNQVTSASLRYPLSVFNKNSTLKRIKILSAKKSKQTAFQSWPIMTRQCPMKAGQGRLFVWASATILCVRKGMSLTNSVLTNWRTK